MLSGVDGHVYIYNLCSRELLDTFTGDGQVSDMTTSADDQFILTAAKVFNLRHKNCRFLNSNNIGDFCFQFFFNLLAFKKMQNVPGNLYNQIKT